MPEIGKIFQLARSLGLAVGRVITTSVDAEVNGFSACSGDTIIEVVGIAASGSDSFPSAIAKYGDACTVMPVSADSVTVRSMLFEYCRHFIFNNISSLMKLSL